MKDLNIFKTKFFFFLLGIIFIPSNPIKAADESNYFCSVFTDEGNITHRICGNSGSVTFVANYPKKSNAKKFSWNCQAEEINGGLKEGLEDSGRIKIFSTPRKIGHLTIFSRQGKLFYFWIERDKEKIVPCGKSNWFTCKNSGSSFWFASSEQNGSQFRAKKIKDLKDYPFGGVYTVSTEKSLLILWNGNDDWNSFSSPDQINVGRLNLADFSFKLRNEEKKDQTNQPSGLKEMQTLMADKNLITKEEIDLEWEKMTVGPVAIELPQETVKLESLNDSAGEMALFLELKKKVTADDEAVSSEEDETQNINNPLGDEKKKTCFYNKPGVYRPSLSIEYEDGKRIACAPMP